MGNAPMSLQMRGARLNSATVKNLVLVDQIPLLRKAIEELESWHEKIENLEIEIQKFQEHDLKLFNDWSSLTLQKHQADIEILQEQYKKMITFHNWVVYTADDLNISLPQAYHLMILEEQLYQKGTKAEKEKIDEIRFARDAGLHEQIHGDDSSNDEEEGTEDPRTREEKITDARGLYEERLQFFERLSDKKVKQLMQDFDEALYFLVECVGICIETYRYDLILRIWNLAPAKVKKTFNEGFKSQFGVTLDAFLERAGNKAREDAGVDEDDEFDFSAHFEGPLADKKRRRDDKPENVELAKILYRRLMLKVHPDKLPPDFVTTKKSWLDRLWKKIQTAYTEADSAALEKLHLQVLITLKKYDEVSFSELKIGSGLLKKEHNRIFESQRQTREHPAWGFAQLKTYAGLEKKITEPYSENKKLLRKEMTRIAKLHQALAEAASVAVQNGGFARKRPQPRRKKRKPRRQSSRY